MRNKCRICLVDGAKLPIFESIESKESVFSKLVQCFKENIEDVEGYPRNICILCYDTLNIVCNFITKYKTSCKLLESGLIVVKKEIHSDNEFFDNDMDLWFKGVGVEIQKEEPDSDSIESLYESANRQVLLAHENQCNNLTKIENKLKSLKEINFKKKPGRKRVRKTEKAATILKEKLAGNGESLKSNNLTEPKEELHDKCIKENLPRSATNSQPRRRMLCDICGQVFRDIQLHMRDKHLDKQMKCPQCPQSSRYYTLRNLNRHTKTIHNKKEYFCDICGSGFALQGGLRSHMKRVHDPNPKIKRIICDICNKSFSNGKCRLIHERSVHTGLRPAQCTVCEASFYHEDYLKEHMRLHTGETPFKCPICGRGYAQRGNMKSHIAHNHQLVDLSEEQMKNFKPSWFKYLKKS